MIQAKSSLYRSGHNMQNIVSVLATKAIKNNINQIVDRLILSASVYYIWNERNKRMFQKSSRTEDKLARNVCHVFCNLLVIIPIFLSSTVGDLRMLKSTTLDVLVNWEDRFFLALVCCFKEWVMNLLGLSTVLP
ncbi:hypothetical protein Tco_1471705 [Tanacetum coccineum]